MAHLDQVSWARLLTVYRRRAGMTKTQLARGLLVTVGYVSKLEAGQKPPPEGQRDSLCELLNLSEEEGRHFHIQAELERTDPTALKYLLQAGDLKSSAAEPAVALQELEGDTTDQTLPIVPVINKVAAGYPQDFTDLDYPVGVAEEYISVPDVSDPNAFAFYVHGDSMQPQFPPGTLLIASPNTASFDGDPCFVRFSATSKVSGCTFKQVYFMRNGRIRLVPMNHSYQEQVYDQHDVSGLWPVIRHYGRISRQSENTSRRTRTARGRTSGQRGTRTRAAAG